MDVWARWQVAVMRAAVAVLRRAGKVAAGTVPTALVAGLGLPALGALVFLAVLVTGAACWIIGSKDRTDRVSRVLLAWRGNAGCLARDGAIPPPARRRGGGSGPGAPDRPAWLLHIGPYGVAHGLAPADRSADSRQTRVCCRSIADAGVLVMAALTGQRLWGTGRRRALARAAEPSPHPPPPMPLNLGSAMNLAQALNWTNK